MECRCIEDIKEFQDIAKEWDEAIILSGEDNPFLLSDFIMSWWKYYSQNRKLLIYAIHDDRGQLAAGIPLCIERKDFRKTITHIGGCDANVTHFFSKNTGLNLIEHLMSSLKKREDWDIFILDRVLSTNALIKQIGELKLQRISGASNIRSLFRAYRKLSIRAFRMRNNVSAFENKRRYSFYEELLILFDKKNRLDAHILTAGAYTLGISFGYRFGRGFKWILTAFNPDFYQLRPGHLLIEVLINEAINSGDPYFDMYYGGEVFYKQQWCPEMIPLKRIEICRNNFFNKSVSLTRNALRSNKIFMDSARKVKRVAQKIFI